MKDEGTGAPAGPRGPVGSPGKSGGAPKGPRGPVGRPAKVVVRSRKGAGGVAMPAKAPAGPRGPAGSPGAKEPKYVVPKRPRMFPGERGLLEDARKPRLGDRAFWGGIGSNLYYGTGLAGVGDIIRHPTDIWNSTTRMGAINERADRDAKNIGEFATGYKEIGNIGSDPLSGGVALASIFPFSRGLRAFAEAAKAGKGAEEGARIGEAASAAKGSFEAGQGVVAPVVKAGGRAAKRAVKKAAIRGAARSEEQTVQHVLEAAKKARQQGFGRVIPKVPEVKPGEVTPETGGEPGKIVREGLKPGTDLGPLRTEQELARTVERGKRAGVAEAASAGKSGLDRHIAAKSALGGELPRGEFKGFDALTPELRDEAINHIYEHPHLQLFEKVRTADALDEAIAGKVPTLGDQKLLERAFGKELPSGIFGTLNKAGWRNTLYNILGVPRSLMASGDISAPFRQGLVVFASHPQLFFSEFRPMLRSLKSESDFQALMGSVHQMPTFPMMEKAGLSLTDIGETAHGVENLSSREEQFVSNLAEQIPGVGHVVRASDRAYVGFLNKTRADLFDTLVHQAAAEGYHLNDKAVADIAKFVNSATGRGDIGALASHTATMNALFFSPRLLMSRLNFLNPLYYARLSPFARKEALQAAGRLGGMLGLILFTAKMAGAKVGVDPRNADFGKVRIGDTRIDIAGGFQQPLRLAAQLATGEIVSSTSGKLEPLAGGFAGRSRLDVLQQFLENKLAPVPGIVAAGLKGQQASGQPLDWSLNPLDTNSEIGGHLLPLSWQDAMSTGQQTHSAAAGIGGGLLSSIGVGVQSYSAAKANSPEKVKAATEKALTKLQEEETHVNVPSDVQPQLDNAVKLQVRLELAKRQAAKVSSDGKLTAKQSYKITLRTLRDAGMMTADQYRAGIAAMPRMNDHDFGLWEYEAWTNIGPGKLLAEFHHAYNVATGS